MQRYSQINVQMDHFTMRIPKFFSPDGERTQPNNIRLRCLRRRGAARRELGIEKSILPSYFEIDRITVTNSSICINIFATWLAALLASPMLSCFFFAFTRGHPMMHKINTPKRYTIYKHYYHKAHGRFNHKLHQQTIHIHNTHNIQTFFAKQIHKPMRIREFSHKRHGDSYILSYRPLIPPRTNRAFSLNFIPYPQYILTFSREKHKKHVWERSDSRLGTVMTAKSDLCLAQSQALYQFLIVACAPQA